MEEILHVFNSDVVNRYGFRFSVGALVSMVHDNCLLGVPALIAHDFSRPIGWSFPFAIHLEPGLTRAVNLILMPETEDEKALLDRQFRYYHHKTVVEPHQAEIARLRVLLADVLQGQEKVVGQEYVALYEPGLALRKFEALFDQSDKDGLLPLSLLEAVGPGVYKRGDFILFAHCYFRRNLFRLNTMNYPLLTQLEDLAAKGSTIRVALDPDMVGLAQSYTGSVTELQYWWGPIFNDDLASIPAGVTHHEADERKRKILGIVATQFRWGTMNGHKVFEAEELRNLPSTVVSPSNQYGCRYAHSIVNVDKGLITHLDGAVRLYSEEKMVARLDTTLDKAPRDTEYTKLWRVDGNLEVSVWKRLLSDHFRDNTLVGEYLGADKGSIDAYSRVEDKQTRSVIEKYVPYSMTESAGVTILLSFTDLQKYSDMDKPVVIALDSLSLGVVNSPVVESTTLELRKILRELGSDLVIEPSVGFVSFPDLYVNLPLIFFGKSCSSQAVSLTQQALKTLIGIWRNTGYYEVVCFKFGFAVDVERAAIISVMGHIADVTNWLESGLIDVPRHHEGICDWAERCRDYLESQPSSSERIPSLLDTVMPSGILHINRQLVHMKNIAVEYSQAHQRHTWSGQVIGINAEELSAIREAGITPTLGIYVIESHCTRCEQPYEMCACSSLLDDDVVREKTNAIPFTFWTDRPRV